MADTSVTELLKASDERNLTRDEIISLLEISPVSSDFYTLLQKANQLTREEYHNKAYIFSQVGLNARPCSGNCKFCSLSSKNFSVSCQFEKTMKDIEEIKETVTRLVNEGTHDVFLMTTADYPMKEYLKIGREVRKILPDSVRLVANTADFDGEGAKKLKEAGFTGVYHICRLGEGIDTDLSPELRLKTIDCIVDAGLELYYCVEPIGPEHTYGQIADEMIRARDLHVAAMAVMRRTAVPDTPLYDRGMISSLELTKIAAAARIACRPSRSMNVHEVTPMSLVAGVNQLYAEAGANPRDREAETSVGRGYSVGSVKNLLTEAQFELA